ncbi:MAG TPA: hypothetical protein PKJ64_15330, partial [bacterium]|nr:hypothetical protein [bacterium]
ITLLSTIIPPGLEYLLKVDTELKGEGLRFITLDFNKKTIFMAPVPGRKEWLFVLCEPEVNLGGLRMAFKKQAPLLSELL